MRPTRWYWHCTDSYIAVGKQGQVLPNQDGRGLGRAHMDESSVNVRVEALTVRAARALRRSSDAHRDALLECGRCCYEILLLRQQAGYYSYGARKALADRLSAEVGYRVDVCRFVTCDRIVTLLGDGKTGRLGLMTIRAFYPFLQRIPAAASPGSLVRDRYRLARSEEYELVPHWAAIGKTLYATAVTECWIERRTIVEVRRATGLKGYGSGHGAAEGRFGADGEANTRHMRAAALSCPRDLADTILKMVEESSDPAAVASLVKREIDKAAALGRQRALVRAPAEGE